MANKRIDWAAIERDFRTARYTQAELARLHGVDQATLSRRIKRDRTANANAWPQDLTQAVREATNARLLSEMIRTEVNEGQVRVKDTVLAAAEMRASVILAHRQRLTQLVRDTDQARQVVMRMADDISGVREAAVLVGAIEALARTTRSIIDKEREAFGLPEGNALERPLGDLELAARLAYFVDIARERKAMGFTSSASTSTT